MKKSLLFLAAIAAFALGFTACDKAKPEDETPKEEVLDFTKVNLAGTTWTLDFYSYDLKGSSSMWSHGGDAELKTLVYKGAHVYFSDKGLCEIIEDEQIFAPYSWDASRSGLAIGWEDGYENYAAVEFSLSADKKTVTMFWDSDVRGAYPLVTMKMSIDKDVLFK